MSTNRPRRRRRDEEPEPTPPKKGRLNNMEMLGIALFGLALMLYAMSKCGKEPEVETEPIVTEEVVDSTVIEEEPRDSSESSYSGITEAPTAPISGGGDTILIAPKLYILVDSLRLRKEPQIGADVVAYLREGEEVVDLGERSALEKIRISVDEVRTAPWVKVKTNKGREGWAFGAYMQFYKLPTETPTNNN